MTQGEFSTHEDYLQGFDAAGNTQIREEEEGGEESFLGILIVTVMEGRDATELHPPSP